MLHSYARDELILVARCLQEVLIQIGFVGDTQVFGAVRPISFATPLGLKLGLTKFDAANQVFVTYEVFFGPSGATSVENGRS